MRRTLKNFEKIIDKKERAAWNELKCCEVFGKESVKYQRALSEWAALISVRYMFENQEVFDTAYDVWVKRQTR